MIPTPQRRHARIDGWFERRLERRLERWISRYVAFSERRAGAIVVAGAVVFLLTLWPVSQLEIRTDMAELLSEDHPAVVALKSISGRQRSSSNLILLISSPDPQQNRRLADALKAPLERLVPSTLSEIQWRPDNQVPDFARRHRWLYADLKDLRAAEELLDRVIAKRSSPLMVDLSGDPDQELRSLRQQLETRLPPSEKADYFTGREGDTHYLGVRLWRHGGGFAGSSDREVVALVREVVRQARPESFHPAMKVEYTGHIQMALEEHDALRDDLTFATVLCGTLVLLAVYLYFRRLGLLLVVGTPAVLGLMLALVIARFAIHYLNANTAFLTSIILGNGINSPIVLLARFGEERRRGVEVPAALRTAMRSSLLGTVTAMTAASIAYGSLLGTSLRGLSQFGLIGGTGMLLVWILTFLLVPAMVLFGERVWPGRLSPRGDWWRAPFALLGGAVARRPLVLVVLALASFAVAAPRVARYLRNPIEWDLTRLRSEDTGAQKRWNKMYQLGMGYAGAGHVGRDGVLLVDRPEQAAPVAEALLRQDRDQGERRLLEAVRTVRSALPVDQEEKLSVLARLRDKIDRRRDLMNDDERREIDEWRPPEYLRALAVEDLPPSVREAFTEVDGTFGRLVGIDADPNRFNDHDGRMLIRFARSLEVDALGKRWVAASTPTIFASMLEVIAREGPTVAATALVGVVLLLLVAFGAGGTAVVLLSLGAGLVWLGGLLDWISLKLNFVNFVALPITFGVGIEYGSNLWARLRSEPAGEEAAAVADTGSAVALCALTTIIGYSSLLVSRNGALRSFGALADLGEVTCLCAALLVMAPAVCLARRRRPVRQN